MFSASTAFYFKTFLLFFFFASFCLVWETATARVLFFRTETKKKGGGEISFLHLKPDATNLNIPTPITAPLKYFTNDQQMTNSCGLPLCSCRMWFIYSLVLHLAKSVQRDQCQLISFFFFFCVLFWFLSSDKKKIKKSAGNINCNRRFSLNWLVESVEEKKLNIFHKLFVNSFRINRAE